MADRSTPGTQPQSGAVYTTEQVGKDKTVNAATILSVSGFLCLSPALGAVVLILVAEYAKGADSRRSKSAHGASTFPGVGSSYPCMTCGQEAFLWPEVYTISQHPICLRCASLIGRNN